MTTALKRWLPQTVSLVVVLTLGVLAMEPGADETELAALATGLKFDAPTTMAAAEGVPLASVRAVHPSLARISGWISSVGASAALGDLDGDGLPNDLCDVDPRTDRVSVRPVPGTGARYPMFSLGTGTLRWDATMAPMGCLLADLNEDGWLDVEIGRAHV